jgi:acyl-CoA synthetase (AMP-forming)/AMP-acid ligase II
MSSNPTTGPVPTAEDQTLTDLLRRWAVERPHQPAFTFVDYPELDSPGRQHTLTWGRLAARAEELAGRLRQAARPGDRAALLMPQGLDYVTGFLACLLAQVVAVPLFSPDLPGHEGQLAAVLEDCEPACALVTVAGVGLVGEHVGKARIGQLPLVVVETGQNDTDDDSDANASADEAVASASPRAARAAAVPTPAPAASRAGSASGSADLPDLPDLPRPGLDEIAYLQYTSGSTRTPVGVMISHRNVLADARQALTAFAAPEGAGTLVGWLPLFRDMGLVLSVAAPVYAGLSSVLIDPVAFLEKPVRWLRLLSQYPDAMSAAPDSAFDYCASRVGPDQVAGLRLDRVRALINGGEPVRRESIRRFQSALGPAGLRPEAHCPSYGLAEATAFVATDGPDEPVHEVVCRRDALAEGRIVKAANQDANSNVDSAAAVGRIAKPGNGNSACDNSACDNSGSDNLSSAETGNADDYAVNAAEAVTTLIACGVPVGQELLVVDPATKAIQPENLVGEILVRGPNIGLGYWKNTEQTAETFEFVLPSTGERPWLRTGDLGAIHRGRLLVTGRIKDLLIADGRTHYPQDVEDTIESALACVRRGRIAVFAVPAEEGELVVAVAEHRREQVPDDATRAEADRIARARAATAHGLRLDRIVLVGPGRVARTSSGKVSRSACRAAYLRGEYADPWESGR